MFNFEQPTYGASEKINHRSPEREDFVKIVQKGQYVRHFQYGLGVVTESDTERTTIDFDLHGIKKFVTSLMVVEPIEGTPPERPREKRRKKAIAAPAPATTAGAK